MKTQRFYFVLAWTIAIATTTASASDEDSEPAQTDEHENYPRIFGIFTRPKPEASAERGVGLKKHIVNVFGGGSIGIQKEFSPFRPIHGIIDHAKKFIPFPGLVAAKEPGKNPGPGHNPEVVHPQTKPDGHGSKPDEWEKKDPRVGVPDGPKWEDIGEDDNPEDDVDDKVDLEHLINPRRRPKRFIESKIYHVPVEFISNAKPTEVKVNGNHI